MLLFHITCRHHIKKIAPDGVLNVTESNIGAPEIMSLKLHRKIAEDELITTQRGEILLTEETPLVMVWNPNDRTEALTMPRLLLEKAQAAGSDMYALLTDEEIRKEVGNKGTYQAKVVVNLETGVTTDDGKYGDIFTDTLATEDDLSPYGEHVGPDVVWLTRDPTPRQGWAEPRGGDWESLPKEYRKDSVLIAVEVPDNEVHKWSEWAFKQGISQGWYDALAMDQDEHEDWYVVERPIPSTEWVGMWDLYTGQCAWVPPGTLPEGHQDEQGFLHDQHGYDIPLPESWVPVRLRRMK